MNIYDYPNLCASLGAHRTDRIAIQTSKEYKPSSKRVRVIENPHRQLLMWKAFGEIPAVEDILVGVCRADDGTGKGLNPARLYTVLSCAERISTELLVDVLNLQERQARRYMAAAKLAIMFISRHIANHPEEMETDD